MSQVVYWRRELPPLSEQIEGEHDLEAESPHLHYELGDRQLMWSKCYPLLLEQAESRIRQELTRLHGSCAHVVDEQITAKVDDAQSLFWLRGRFQFVMYVHTSK